MSASSAVRVPRKQSNKRDFFAVIKEDFFHLMEKNPREPHSRVSGESQVAAVVLIVNETYGRAFGSTPPLYACLTHREFAKKAGCTIRQIVDILADAEKRKLIESIDFKQAVELGLVGPKHRGHQQAKWYRALPENWAKAPKYSPPKPKLVVMAPPDDEPEDEGDGDGAAVVKVPPDQPLVLMPGAKSRPVPWVSKATKYSFDCSGVTVPLSIQREFAFGVVKFKIGQPIQEVAANSRVENRRTNGEPPMQCGSGVEGVAKLIPPVRGALCKWATPDEDAILRLIRECRANRPDCTDAEIVHFIHVKGPSAAKAEKPMGFFLKVIPPCFKGESFEEFRRIRRSHAAALQQANEASAQADRQYAAMILEMETDDPHVTKEDREWARQILKK